MAQEQAGAAVPSSRLLVGPALAIASIALAGSLWLSLVMELKACPLCFYQRSFVMGVVAILGIGSLCAARHRRILPVLALPLAVAAFSTAVFHVRLELTGILECPAGIFGIGTAPGQSAAITGLLTVVLALGAFRSGERALASLAGGVLGVMLSWAAIASAPPAPAPPAAPHAAPLETCRPPYRAP